MKSGKLFCCYKPAIIAAVILGSMLLSCNTDCRKSVSSEDTQPVELSIVYIDDNFMEDSVQQRENVEKHRRICMEFKLKNNSSVNKYIPAQGLSDSIYSSNLGFYVNGVDIAGMKLFGKLGNLDNMILHPNDSVFCKIIVLGNNLKDAGLRENIPLPELLSQLQVRYAKDASDTVYSKYPIADIKVVRYLDIVVNYKSYEERNDYSD